MTNKQSLSPWLSLREPVDHAARSEALTQLLVEHLPASRPIRVLDLGTGRGSNVRYLSPRLPRPQEWIVVDREADLLAEVSAQFQTNQSDVRVDTRCEDLVLLTPDLFVGRHLVTASALLDLVSDSWLRRLAARCRENLACALFALTYNGDSICDPAEPEDELIVELLNRHQSTDKGLGMAAGPRANTAAVAAFKDVGYEVRYERTQWQLSPDAGELQRELMQGWANAALELEPAEAPAIADWLGRRYAHLEKGQSRIAVGHFDLVAWPR